MNLAITGGSFLFFASPVNIPAYLGHSLNFNSLISQAASKSAAANYCEFGESTTKLRRVILDASEKRVSSFIGNISEREEAMVSTPGPHNFRRHWRRTVELTESCT